MRSWASNEDMFDAEVAVWSIQFEGPDGPEWGPLDLEVEPSEYFDDDEGDQMEMAWKWSVSAPESPFEGGFAPTL